MRIKLKKALLLFCMFCALSSPVTVYATGNGGTVEDQGTTATGSTGSNTLATSDAAIIDSGNAVDDIMNDDRFQGAISSISFVTKFIDHYMTMAITAVAFFIISAAMLKNVCAGAYCSNQKFWNAVYKAHEAAGKLTVAGLGGKFKEGALSVGSIKNAILVLIPNIKALSDFEDTEMEPKSYFIKSIPQMLCCIIIGVFVYNGYYRDTASTVGQFGSEICERVFTSVDPAAFVDKLTLTTGTPANIYKNDVTDQGQMNYDISMGIYRKCVSQFSGYDTTETKTSLMRTCEKAASDMTNGEPFSSNSIFANTSYSYTLSGLKVIAASDDGSHGSKTYNGGGFQQDEKGNFAFTYYVNLATDYGIADVSMTQGNTFVVITGTLNKKSGAGTASSITAAMGTANAEQKNYNLSITSGMTFASNGQVSSSGEKTYTLDNILTAVGVSTSDKSKIKVGTPQAQSAGSMSNAGETYTVGWKGSATKGAALAKLTLTYTDETTGSKEYTVYFILN